ncbi:hypothetical protein GW17_00058055 [Ensete ventricosum]|nr:hypothetical protein GW17_00058055 [Ensete ventricosum]
MAMMVAAARRLAGRSGAAPALSSVVLRSATLQTMAGAFREERDTFGPIMVPADRLVPPAASTQRSLQNFDIGGEREQMPEPIIRAFGVLKKCAAKVVSAWLQRGKNKTISVEEKEEEREGVRRRGRIGRTSTHPDLAPPSLDDLDPRGNDEVAARVAEEAVSFIASYCDSVTSSPKAGDICDLRRLCRMPQMKR